MEIIHRGNPEPKKVQSTCRNCESVLEERADKLNWENDRNDRLAREKCPVCGAEIFFYQ